MSRSIAGPPICRALRLRDFALTVVRRQGTWEQCGNGKWLMARHGTISIAYRTPFQQLFGLPYGLDIWAPNKVMNLEWDDKGGVILVSFRPGGWEAELAAA
jgi:hypothetical protein